MNSTLNLGLYCLNKSHMTANQIVALPTVFYRPLTLPLLAATHMFRRHYVTNFIIFFMKNLVCGLICLSVIIFVVLAFTNS
jgi:hypothetical protein